MSWHACNRAAFRRLLQDRRGVTALEFAFVGLILVVLVLGVVDLGRYQFTVQSLREFTASAARAALIDANQVGAQQANGNAGASPAGNEALKSAVMTPTNPTPFLNAALLNVTTARTTSASGVQIISVTVTYPFEFVAPLLPTGALTLTDSAALSY